MDDLERRIQEAKRRKNSRTVSQAITDGPRVRFSVARLSHAVRQFDEGAPSESAFATAEPPEMPDRTTQQGSLHHDPDVYLGDGFDVEPVARLQHNLWLVESPCTSAWANRALFLFDPAR